MKKINDRTCSNREKERVKQLEAKELKRQQDEQRKEQKRNERESMEMERIRKKKEKDLKLQQDEADKEQKRKEKEAVELEKEQKRKEREAVEAEREQKRKGKELKKQQEDAEKEQKKKEKEAAERKKQLVILKQATIMDKLFRRKEPQTPAHTQRAEEMNAQHFLSPLEPSTGSNSCSSPGTQMAIARMDQELNAIQYSRTVEELLRSHTTAWRVLKKSTTSEKPQGWRLRHKPKVTNYLELRLQGSATTCQMTDSGASHRKYDGVTSEKVPTASIKRSRAALGDFEELKVELDREDKDCMVIKESGDLPRKKLCNERWKLLQFDKSYRPAYYGTFSKASTTVGPRHPLKKDPSLNYEVDSDEEWEEEDPGESLSDCEDKEDDLERIDNEVDEDVADGFVVRDGYLSDSEGVHSDDARGIDDSNLEMSPPPELSCMSQEEVSCSATAIDEEVQKHERLTKLLDNVTKQALLHNRPFIVSTLMTQSGEHRHSQIDLQCVQALKMQVVEPYLVIRAPKEVELQEKSETETKTRKTSKTKDLKRRRIQPSSVISTSSSAAVSVM